MPRGRSAAVAERGAAGRLHSPRGRHNIRTDGLNRRVQVAGFKTVLLADAVILHFGGQSSRLAKNESALLAIAAVNRYFYQWQGAGAGRRHRLVMGGIALIKGAAFTLLNVLSLQADAAQKQRFYRTLLRWAWTPDAIDLPTPTRNAPHLE